MDPNLRLLGIGAALRAFGLSLFGPFAILYLHNVLGVGYAAVGGIAFLLGFAPLLTGMAGGLLADRLGRRILFLGAVGGEAASFFFLAYAMRLASLPLVVGGIAMGWVLGSVAGPANSAYIADLARGAERTRGFTWQRVGWNVGFSAGTTAAGLLIPVIGFSGVVLFTGIVGSLTALLLAARLSPSPYDIGLKPRGARARSPLVRGARRSDRAGDAMGKGPRSFLASLRLLSRDRTFLLLCLAFALESLVVNQWSVTFPLFSYGALGIPYPVLGLGLALNGLVVVFGQTLTTNAAIGRRHTRIALLGMLLYVVAFSTVAVAGEFRVAEVLAFFVSVFVLTLGENLASIPTTTLPSNVAPPEEVGAYNGIFQTLTGVGGLLAFPLGGIALAFLPDPLVLWSCLLLPALPAALLLREAGRRLPPDVDRA